MKKWKRICAGGIALMAVCLFLRLPAKWRAARYAVRGVDVSAAQGTIDWDKIAAQDIAFAFVKATEGSKAVDPRFRENIDGAKDAGLVVGAYHFFSFDSPGGKQAENFIAAAGDLQGCLPPVVDVELYGKHWRDPPSTEEAWEILRPLLDALEERYGVKPILYTSVSSQWLYARDSGYALWRRNVWTEPLGDWLFWQYSDKGALEGYDGEEKYIDLNVFRGTEEALRGMTIGHLSQETDLIR